ncbi:NAD(P)-binding protein [Panus rudis PR-1116 ss-1]|nr:NAD(P)-binding protein [Panus rudis PR-1116 ss-1]
MSADDTTTPQLPDTQKAWLAVKRGVPSNALRLEQQHPVPKNLPKGEILVAVQAAALNPVDYKILKLLPAPISWRPHVMASDFSGIVVDPNGTALSKGQEVFGIIPVELQRKTKQGALAEYLRVPAENVVPRPENINPTQAAGVSLVTLTAYQGLFDVGKLEPGQSLFVNGGSTAVGAAAIQLAKAIGCKVTATASGKNEEYVKSLGADVFIDYTKGPVYKALEDDPPSPKFHLILEAVGNIDLPLWLHSEKYLAPRTAVFMLPSVNQRLSSKVAKYIFETSLRPSWLGGVKRHWRLITLRLKHDQLEHIAKLISEGKLKPPIDSVYSFEDVVKAYERLMTKRARGKVVVKVDPNAT